MTHVLSDLDGTRTHDSLIKSQVLYRLSYEIKNQRFSKAGAKVCQIFRKKQDAAKKNSNENLGQSSSKKGCQKNLKKYSFIFLVIFALWQLIFIFAANICKCLAFVI